MQSFKGHFSLCGRCGRPAVHAVSCPICGRSCCRWKCYAHHLDQHRAVGQPCISAASHDSQEVGTGNDRRQPAARQTVPLPPRTETELSA